jgi:hypothetical protein
LEKIVLETMIALLFSAKIGFAWFPINSQSLIKTCVLGLVMIEVPVKSENKQL